MFGFFSDIRRWWRDFNQQPGMYEVGAFFLSHKMVVHRMKNKKRGK